VESGLSSGAAFDPFPEELVRKLVTRIANIAFCPDTESYNRLRGRRRLVVHDTHGNTIADALRIVLLNAPSQQRGGVLVSLHRFENIMHRSRLEKLVVDILRLATQRPVSFVLHPPTEKRLRVLGLLESLRASNAIELLPRMPYSRFMKLAVAVDVVVTDGGSNQEELSLLGVPAIILRSRTERSDGLGRSGLLEPDIVGSWVDFILTGGADALRHPPSLVLATSPSKRIVDVLAVELRA
jgi:UDP-N-acetylglucosamine 2-epimerase (non-hydrolysing)